MPWRTRVKWYVCLSLICVNINLATILLIDCEHSVPGLGDPSIVLVDSLNNTPTRKYLRYTNASTYISQILALSVLSSCGKAERMFMSLRCSDVPPKTSIALPARELGTVIPIRDTSLQCGIIRDHSLRHEIPAFFTMPAEPAWLGAESGQVWC
jgi:hypothetical protein